MVKRVGVIDIGSGTVTLAIFEAGGAGFLDRVDQEGNSLRLIEKIDERGYLSAGAVRSLLATVAGYIKAANARGVERIEVVATSAMRDARNGAELVARINAPPLVNARLVSGEEEGRLAAHTAICTLPLRDGVVLDLGGGSMQLVWVVGRRVVETASLPLGALRLHEAFLKGADPVPADSLVALRHHVLEHLRTVPWFKNIGGRLVAVGGSARSLGKMDRRARGAAAGHGHGYRLDTEAVLDRYERLSRMTSAERAPLPGLPEHRTDTIVAASATLWTALRIGGFGQMYLSTYGIREGVAFRALYGERPIADPGGAGIRGRLGEHPLRRPPAVPGLTPRERRLFAAAMDHPPEWLLDKPIQGFWQDEVLRVAAAISGSRPAS